MQNSSDTADLYIGIAFLVIVLVGFIIHYLRPITWQDYEGHVLDDDGWEPDLPGRRWWRKFRATLLRYLLPWQR